VVFSDPVLFIAAMMLPPCGGCGCVQWGSCEQPAPTIWTWAFTPASALTIGRLIDALPPPAPLPSVAAAPEQ